MPTLKQQMEGLKKPINPLFPERCHGFNQAIETCLALLADHDQEAYKRGFIDGGLSK